MTQTHTIVLTLTASDHWSFEEAMKSASEAAKAATGDRPLKIAGINVRKGAARVR